DHPRKLHRAGRAEPLAHRALLRLGGGNARGEGGGEDSHLAPRTRFRHRLRLRRCDS
ncbi:unnamed protein product, partial [Effrenium voratum]